jgi:hypothetical protein
MGMIFDLDDPAARPATTRRHRVRKPAPRIELDTPIVPRAVAMGVCEEACVWLHEELPREWVNKLAARANVIYARNPRFRRLLRCQGNAGRDWLWAFTRRWLAALIRKYRPDLHARLPAHYSVGGDLPQGGNLSRPIGPTSK